MFATLALVLVIALSSVTILLLVEEEPNQHDVYAQNQTQAPTNFTKLFSTEEEFQRRLSELSNRLGDEDQVKRESANRTNLEYANIRQDLTKEFLKFLKMSEECEMNRDIVEAFVYKDIAEEINVALKKFENI